MKKMQKADGQSKKKGTDWRRSGFAWILTVLFLFVWCCTIKVDIENSKGQYIEKDKQEATKDGSESTKIQHGI